MKTINKETICDQAVELFLSQGYNNVTVNDICTALNITKPTFYKYVSSKEELILDLYDRTISGLLNDPLHFIEADTHLEQLYLIFGTLVDDTEKFGCDLFSQMLITNLTVDHHSFDMRKNLTKISEVIIRKAQEKKEIRNMSDPLVLYSTIAYSFTGYEVVWCIRNGHLNWKQKMFKSINAVLIVDEKYKDLYKRFL